MWAETYEEARASFRAEALDRGGRLESIEVVPAEPGEAEGLTIDAAVFGEAPRAVLVTSGLHGVEGFAGSAIQRAALAEGWPADMRLVLVHALNPFGMARRRRVNENNVDLNRNWLPEGEAYAGSPDGYKALDGMLNPTTPHGGFELFLAQAVWQIVRHGMPALKQAVVGGQYDFPKGLFFGGSRLERGPTLLSDALPRWLAGADRIVHLDVHTGLGTSGEYALLVDAPSKSESYLRMRKKFGDRVQPWDPDEGVAYAIRGGFPAAVARLFPGRVDTITQEFGTVPALNVIAALRSENRAVHWGGDTDGAKAALLDVFRPRSEKWRASVLEGGRTVLARAYEAVHD